MKRTLASLFVPRAAIAALILGAGMPATRVGAGAERKITPGSSLAVEVWQHPELSREVEVDAAGRIDFPPIGQMGTEGLTPSALAQRIGDGLTAFLREAASVTAREVFPVTVNGFVARPGRIPFEHPPTLVEAILDAGGPLPGAWLDRVIIYRRGDPGGIQMAGVAEAFATGGGGNSPILARGDLVFVRGETPTGGAGAGSAGGAPSADLSASGAGGVVVLQGVVGPGLYPLPRDADAFTALAMARGPAPGADLGRTLVLSRQGGGRVAYQVDLRAPGAGKPPRSFPLRDGDVVQVGGEHSSFGGKAWSGVRGLLSVSRDLVGAYLLFHALVK